MLLRLLTSTSAQAGASHIRLAGLGKPLHSLLEGSSFYRPDFMILWYIIVEAPRRLAKLSRPAFAD